MRRYQLQGLAPVIRFRHDVDTIQALQQRPKSSPHEGMVVSQ
jgi:hypothetical protein